MKLLRLAAWTVWFTLGWIALAHAEPVSGIIALISGIIAKGGVAALAIKAAFGIALHVGQSLLQKAMARRQPQPGITGQVQVGGSNSISFIVGSYATAGSLEYINTGSVIPNKAPNNTLVQVISVSDMPVTAIKDTVWIGGEKCTRSTSVPVPGDNGARLGPQSYPLVEYKDGAYYYLFARYFLGDQTAAMPEMVSLFGSDPDKPWQSDMIGRGVAWVALSAYVSRKLMTSIPSARFEVDGIRLYDPRKDTTVGGSGAQRWGQPATYAFSNNPAVIVYNILRGIFYEGELVYGPAIPAARLPLGNWIAAMNECDLPVQVATGTGGQAIYEPQYRAGYEIKVAEHQPIDVILELLKGCNGKIAETGGIYKIRVGAAALPVAFVSDEDFIVTEEQEFDPFPGLENTYNGATATYPEPDAGWEMKDAPQQLFPDLESEDDGRRLLADFQFNAVPHPFQVQRLAMAMVQDGRRFRKHRGTLPPWAFALEPLDTIAWTSPREGYIAKHFEIDSMDDLVNANQAIACRETDPSDFDWNFSTDALPWSVGPIVPNWPTPQPITGWQAMPGEIKDADGTGRRPSIEVRFDGQQEDVRAVRITARLNADNSVVFDGEVPYGDPTTNPASKSVILNAVFLPDTYYTAEGVYVPFSSRSVLPSAPMLVKTPDIRLGDFDVDFEPIKREVEDWTKEQLEDNEELIKQVHGNVRKLADDARKLALQVIEQSSKNYKDHKESITRLSSTYDKVTAEYLNQITVATGPGSALGQRIEAIEVKIPTLAEATAINALTVIVNNQGGTINALSQSLLDLGVVVEGKASANSVLLLSNRVTATESEIDVLQDAMLAVQTTLPDKADASAVLALSNRVTATENNISSLSTAVLAVQTSVGKVTAGGSISIESGATSSDGYAQIVISTSANSGATFEDAALILQAKTSGTPRSRAVVKAGQFAVLDGAGTAYAIFDGTTAWFERARIRELDATNINVAALLASSAFIANLRITNSLQLDPGVVITGSIASGAITNSASSTTWTMTAWDPSVVYTVGSITINSETGQPITFSSRCEYTQRFGSNNVGNGHVFIEFYYVISGITYVVDSVYSTIHPSEWIDIMHSRQCSLFFKPPSPGTYTAELRMRATMLNAGPYYPDTRATGTFSSHAVCNRR